HESRDEFARDLPDIAGIVLSVVGMGLLTYGIIQSEAYGWSDRRVLAALGASVLALVLFLRRSATSSSPVLDLSLFQDRNYRFSNAATLTFSIGFSAMYIGNVFFLTQVWRYSTLRAGLALTPAPLIVVPIAVISGRIAAKLGHRPVIVPGGLLFAAAGLGQWSGLTRDPTYLSQWLPATILPGHGVGLSISPLASAAVHGIDSARYALGGAVNSSIRQLGGVLGVAFAFTLLGRHPQSAGIMDFRRIFVLMMACGLLTAILAAGITTRGAQSKDVGFDNGR